MAVLGVAALAWLSVVGPGCGGSSSNPTVEACTTGCQNTMALGCNSSCDCAKCAQVPASCSSALGCVVAATSCAEQNACPSPPADCAAFLATLCQ
jgi:hypothetical protein